MGAGRAALPGRLGGPQSRGRGAQSGRRPRRESPLRGSSGSPWGRRVRGAAGRGDPGSRSSAGLAAGSTARGRLGARSRSRGGRVCLWSWRPAQVPRVRAGGSGPAVPERVDDVAGPGQEAGRGAGGAGTARLWDLRARLACGTPARCSSRVPAVFPAGLALLSGTPRAPAVCRSVDRSAVPRSPAWVPSGPAVRGDAASARERKFWSWVSRWLPSAGTPPRRPPAATPSARPGAEGGADGRERAGRGGRDSRIAPSPPAVPLPPHEPAARPENPASGGHPRLPAL